MNHIKNHSRSFFYIIFPLLLLTLLQLKTVAQDSTDIGKMLEDEIKASEKKKTEYVTATFKTTRLVNGHSLENTARHVLDVKISHRFGTISGANGGAYNLFGLDNATMRMGFDYGLTNTLMIGIGRSTDYKTFDGLVKFKLLRQSTGKITMPVTLSYVPTISYESFNPGDSILRTDLKKYRSHRLSFSNQILIGRKFSEGLSLQLMPTLVHRNFPHDGGPHDIYAIGIGGRQKLGKRTSFNAEYYYQVQSSRVPGSHDALSFGFDIETGGHVFQLHMTNSQGMTETKFVPGSIYSWGKGEILFGFNISRVFNVGKKH